MLKSSRCRYAAEGRLKRKGTVCHWRSFGGLQRLKWSDIASRQSAVILVVEVVIARLNAECGTPKRLDLSSEVIKVLTAFDGSYFTLAAINQTGRSRPKAKITSVLDRRVAHSFRQRRIPKRSLMFRNDGVAGRDVLDSWRWLVPGVGLGNEVTIDAVAEMLKYAETL